MNRSTIGDVLKSQANYKAFSYGKSYKIIGFGKAVIDGKLNRTWVLMSLYDNNLEFEVFKKTINILIEKKVLLKIN